MKTTGYNWRRDLPWLYNCAFPVVTMEEQNGLGSVSPMVSFETNPYLLSAIKTFCIEKKKRWVLWVSHQLQSVILVSFFSLCLKRDYRKKGKIAWCIGLPLEGSSSLRWTIRSPLQKYCAILPRMWKGGDMYLRLRGNDRQSCTVVPKMYLITSLYLSIFTEISSKSRIFTLFN